MRGGRHLIAEHPQGSEMWKMPAWTRLVAEWPLAWTVIHQCAAGLRGPKTRHPIKKPTEFWASDPALLAHIKGFRCDGPHAHSQLGAREAGAPAEKAKDAARWPLRLCQGLAKGCEDVLRSEH